MKVRVSFIYDFLICAMLTVLFVGTVTAQRPNRFSWGASKSFVESSVGSNGVVIKNGEYVIKKNNIFRSADIVTSYYLYDNKLAMIEVDFSELANVGSVASETKAIKYMLKKKYGKPKIRTNGDCDKRGRTTYTFITHRSEITLSYGRLKRGKRIIVTYVPLEPVEKNDNKLRTLL